jgi:hypothetical protein
MKNLALGFLLAAAWLAGPASARAQTAEEDTLRIVETYTRRRMVGLNLTPLLTQLVPLNRADPRESGPYLVRFKKYGPLGRSGFRFSMGVRVGLDEIEEERIQLNLAFGFERRRSISKRWSYTRGFDAMILAGDLATPGTDTAEDAFAIAVAPVWGIEFAIDDYMTVGAEAALALGLAFEEGVFFEILPPVGVFLQHYF